MTRGYRWKAELDWAERFVAANKAAGRLELCYVQQKNGTKSRCRNEKERARWEQFHSGAMGNLTRVRGLRLGSL